MGERDSSVGGVVGEFVGPTTIASEGYGTVGRKVGLKVGLPGFLGRVGIDDGASVGADGTPDGALLGAWVGWIVGVEDCTLLVGALVGAELVGAKVGISFCDNDGRCVGAEVGEADGGREGAAVGLGLACCSVPRLST